SEHRGLPARVLQRLPPENQLAIPMREGNRSLNLANAVSIVVYVAWRQAGFAGSRLPTSAFRPE
ncbi:MAG: tRNA (cytidine(34)-2'-O)-methyltransferase, partial [Steroidobacteraceae bacterium]